jgi:integrase
MARVGRLTLGALAQEAALTRTAIVNIEKGRQQILLHTVVEITLALAIYQVTTRMWRRECAAVGLAGLTFHSMRHSWASWQVQAETPLRILQELGGWKSLQMPQRYSHLNPGHLAAYASRSLLAGGSAEPTKPASDTDTEDP